MRTPIPHSIEDALRIAANRLGLRLRELDVLVSRSNALAENIGGLKSRKADLEVALQSFLGSTVPTLAKSDQQVLNGIAFYRLCYELSGSISAEERELWLEQCNIKDQMAMMQAEMVQDLRSGA